MKKMLEGLSVIKKAVLAGLLLIGVGTGCWFAGSLAANSSSKTEITEDTLFQQVQAISQLAVQEYNYTNMGKFENSASLNGWTIPLTKKSFILAYDGLIMAGIDLDKLAISIDHKTITITVPKAEVLSHVIDESSIEIYDESNNLFNPISINDYTTFSTTQKQVMEEKAIAGGLLEVAQVRSRDVLNQLLSMNEAVRTEYELIFKLAK